MKKIPIIIVSVLLLISCNQYNSSYFVEGVSNPVINLNGTWKVNTNPSGEYWKIGLLNEEWKDIQVPGECMMQGFLIKQDKPFAYKKSIQIPPDFDRKKIKLQFDGVYSYARVWINGNYVGDHSGGFTRWECDITPYVTAGESSMLTVEVTDKADEISYASGYAKHPIGGILRDVNLLAFPLNYPEEITIKTNFDENFKNALLILSGKTEVISDHSKITFELFDARHKKIYLENTSIPLNHEQYFQVTNSIINPLKWDAEHPDLYHLKISFTEDGKLFWQKTLRFGFREITLNGNKVLVNGSEIKLRGVCRHDIHPSLGRVSTPEYELKDVILAKEANINFIRTSHYPPTEHFLQLCDEYGLYVEVETAVCFVNTHRGEKYQPGASENNASYTSRYLSQLEEMVTSHKNHPSIIMWSIGNENSFGTNFKKSYDWVKKNDDTRPVIFSYPGNVPDNIRSYDILSMHYPGLTGNMNQYGKVTKGFGYSGMPVIFDEWAHVACYNNFTVTEDLNVRDFWGRGLDRMWQKTFDASGGLGGAIWGMIDETFMLPDSLFGFNESDKNLTPDVYPGNTVGYGEWGIVDTWRRKKPEFWNTKKAYSPVKILKTVIEDYSDGVPVSIPLYNRFDHTNINELTIKLTYNGLGRTLKAPDIQPHTKGILLLPIKGWNPKEKVFLEFFTLNNKLIDKYALSQLPELDITDHPKHSEKIKIEENEKFITIICENNTRIIFDKKTGLINEIQQTSGNYSFSGPFINLRTKGRSIIYSNNKINDYCTDWQLNNFDYKQKDDIVSLHIIGEYNNSIPAEFKLDISSVGDIKTHYHIQNVPQEYIREIGIKFKLDDVFDSLYWERNCYWSYYPPNHLSAPKEIIALHTNIQKSYKNEPKKDWNSDTKSFFYEGPEDELIKDQFTNIARSTKENIRKYCLYKNGQEIISIQSNGSVSGRLEKVSENVHIFANNQMDYVDLNWGNFQRNIILERNYSDEVAFKINTHSTGTYK